MYGTQTKSFRQHLETWFENDVKMYGTQTNGLDSDPHILFENDVKMYGTQTALHISHTLPCLRMM